MGAPDLDPRVPLTSIVDKETTEAAGTRSQPWELYLGALSRQARIALSHLGAVWSFEGEPADVSRWYAEFDEEWLWAELQGAMTASIIIARLLKPGRVFESALQMHADQRGERLRELLDVPATSQLLAVHRVRDSIEHLDERLDSAVADPQVYSVSHAYVARGVRWQSPSAADNVDGANHRNLALFAPEPGLLLFDDDQIDLWALEVDLHNVLRAMPAAYATVRSSGPSPRMGFGSGKMLGWSAEFIRGRRDEIARARVAIKEDGGSSMRLAREPRTVVWRSTQSKIDFDDRSGGDEHIGSG